MGNACEIIIFKTGVLIPQNLKNPDMRVQLLLNCRPGSVLPFNYQYELSAWIYRTLAQANPEFAAWLHERGYALEGKKAFKLFTFSHFDIQKPFSLDKERGALRIDSGRARLVLSFLLDAALEHFVVGLFQSQRFGIGNAQFPATDFEVHTLEILPKPVFSPLMRYRALSPICLTSEEPGKAHAQYRHPDDEEYLGLLIRNLSGKLLTATPHAFSLQGNEHQLVPPAFRLLSDPKRKGVTLKAFTAAETKVIGYTFDFELTAAPILHEVGYYAGFGVENAQGFGCVEVVISD